MREKWPFLKETIFRVYVEREQDREHATMEDATEGEGHATEDMRPRVKDMRPRRMNKDDERDGRGTVHGKGINRCILYHIVRNVVTCSPVHCTQNGPHTPCKYFL